MSLSGSGSEQNGIEIVKCSPGAASWALRAEPED